MKNENDGLYFAFFFLGCPALYLMARSLPVILFYVVPLFGSIFLVGHLWKAICHAEGTNYRRVAWLMSGTILALLITVGFPQDDVVMVKGKILLQSPWLFHAFNDLKQGIESTINWSWLRHFRWIFPSVLPPLTYKPVLYDLRDFSWCLWLGVCFGAPAVFLYYCDKKDQEHIQKFEKNCLAKIATIEHEKFEAVREARQICWQQRDLLAERDEEIKKLKEVVAAIQPAIGPPLLPPPVPTESVGDTPQPATGGVLDAL